MLNYIVVYEFCWMVLSFFCTVGGVALLHGGVVLIVWVVFYNVETMLKSVKRGGPVKRLDVYTF